MSKLAELMVIRAKLASESLKLSDINELREHMGINPIDSQEDMFEDLNQREKVLFSRAVHVTGLLRKWVSLSSPQSFDRPIEELDNQTERSFERTLDLLDKQSRASSESNRSRGQRLHETTLILLRVAYWELCSIPDEQQEAGGWSKPWKWRFMNKMPEDRKRIGPDKLIGRTTQLMRKNRAPQSEIDLLTIARVRPILSTFKTEPRLSDPHTLARLCQVNYP
jgi:hypothetical protein